MKKIIFLLLATISASFAQVPQSFNYQGIARDNAGNPLSSKAISLRLSILSEAGATQTTLYTETHSVTTNQFGLFVLSVGKGTPTLGTFSSVTWTDNTKKILKTEIDPDGNGYSLSLNSELQSVPFALSAKTVETEKQTLTVSGNTLSISQGNSVELPVAADAVWETNSNGINYSSGRIGIGTDNPATRLHIVGNWTGIDRNPIELYNKNSGTDGICGIGLTVNEASTTDRGALQMFSTNYFPALPFWSGRLILGTSIKNGILLDAGAGSTANIELAVGPKNGQETPVRVLISNTGNVGIGTIEPSQKLDVNGKVRIQDLTLNNAASKILVADATGVIGYKDATTLGGGQWSTVSEGINYSQGKVLIGDPSSPHTSSLVISKSATGADRTFSVMENKSNAIDANTASYWFAGTGSNAAALDITVNAKSYFPQLGNTGYGQIRSEKLVLNATGSSSSSVAFISFITGASYGDSNIGTERMRIEKNGFVGIGTSAPKATLHVKGSVYVEDATQGIIMKSASGQCWRVVVGDTGVLTSTAVTCPQ